MGVVYRAVQHHPPTREVALKTVAEGLDARKILQRGESYRNWAAVAASQTENPPTLERRLLTLDDVLAAVALASVISPSRTRSTNRRVKSFTSPPWPMISSGAFPFTRRSRRPIGKGGAAANRGLVDARQGRTTTAMPKHRRGVLTQHGATTPLFPMGYGGTRLEDIERLRHATAYMNSLGTDLSPSDVIRRARSITLRLIGYQPRLNCLQPNITHVPNPTPTR